jgi:hypothetical protein
MALPRRFLKNICCFKSITVSKLKSLQLISFVYNVPNISTVCPELFVSYSDFRPTRNGDYAKLVAKSRAGQNIFSLFDLSTTNWYSAPVTK